MAAPNNNSNSSSHVVVPPAPHIPLHRPPNAKHAFQRYSRSSNSAQSHGGKQPQLAVRVMELFLKSVLFRAFAVTASDPSVFILFSHCFLQGRNNHCLGSSQTLSTN
jgi:hypothetical protein